VTKLWVSQNRDSRKKVQFCHFCSKFHLWDISCTNHYKMLWNAKQERVLILDFEPQMKILELPQYKPPPYEIKEFFCQKKFFLVFFFFEIFLKTCFLFFFRNFFLKYYYFIFFPKLFFTAKLSHFWGTKN
jgi:hypothetical protein